jgi:hypothetical protein
MFVRCLYRYVFPAFTDPEGEGGLELLGAVLARLQGFAFLR